MENSRIGPFQIGKSIGRNRRPSLYRATHLEHGKEFALKFISLSENVDRDEAIAKYHREAELLKPIRHDHLARVYGIGTDGNKIFIVYELVAGESLASVLLRRGRLATDQAVAFGKQLADVLDYLHQQELVHAEVSPDKIIVQDDANVKLVGLRYNRSGKRRWDNLRRPQLETAAYLSPEGLLGHPPTPKHDLYSLGVVLYEMLTGHLPFEPDNIAKLTQQKQKMSPPLVSSQLLNCPFWLDRVVSQLLQPDIRLRMHSAKAVTLALNQVQRIDQVQQSAAEQLASSFNPLHAGIDKSEAKRVFGQTDAKSRSSRNQSVVLSSLGILAALLVIALIFGYALSPVPTAKLMDRAKLLLTSDRATDWQTAREHLQIVMQRNNAGPLAEEAEELYYGSLRKSLIHRIERGINPFESNEAKQFREAYALELDGKTLEAVDSYTVLMATLDPTGEHRHIYEECNERIANLHAAKQKTEQERLDRHNQFTELMQTAERFYANQQYPLAMQAFKQVISEFGNDAEFAETIEVLRNKVQEIEKTLIKEDDEARQTEEGNDKQLELQF
ncbi:MAG TPA: serine/threonine-protein kinase [Pirellulaceae bacterium]|nr:serine/threonine-protein kinase [Pirellulaceae bacterium]HMO90600.1 serine/threonine-protein kinase [Pirellulaceae bacterium]HMP67821.1 serine/threonine-protein kinase [Pirellulaceae bacterium]